MTDFEKALLMELNFMNGLLLSHLELEGLTSNTKNFKFTNYRAAYKKMSRDLEDLVEEDKKA